MMVDLIGVYGGTFDPIHLGHINAAIEIQQTLGMKEVRMVLSARPPHRRQPVLSMEQRFELLTLATENEEKLIADDCEMHRSGPSYMVDTLFQIKQNKPRQSLALILGMEAFNGITQWHRWTDLLDLAHIVVTDRAGFDNEWDVSVIEVVEKHRTFDKAELKKLTHGKIYRQDVTPIDISATQIRAIVQQGQSAKHLLSPVVWAEISNKNLYTQVN